MGEEEFMDNVICPVVLFCARQRFRQYAQLRELIEELLLGMESFGYVDVIWPGAIDSLIEEGIRGVLDQGDSLMPPLTGPQENALRDMLRQMSQPTEDDVDYGQF